MESEAFRAGLIAGDEEVFDSLVRDCHESMYRLARRLLRNSDDAQEVVQEAFLAAFQGRKNFEGRSGIRAWLLSITYNKAVDRLKKKSRDNWEIQGDMAESPFWENVSKVRFFTDWGANPEQSYLRTELIELLDKALQEVPAESRAIFELSDIQGLTGTEIAEALDMSEGAIRVRLHRVHQYLTVTLEKFFGSKET